MKKLNSLAKILFFFFAILSFSLVIVSCNDDEEKYSNEETWMCKMYNDSIIITLKIDKENNVFYTTVKNNTDKTICFTDDEYCKYHITNNVLYVDDFWNGNGQHYSKYCVWTIQNISNSKSIWSFGTVSLDYANPDDTNNIYNYTFKKK